MTALYHNHSATGTIITEEVQMPIDVVHCYSNLIISAPINARNVFDISISTEMFNGVTWISKDEGFFQRGFSDENNPINISIKSRLQNIGGSKIRMRLQLGQNMVALSIVLTQE